MKKLFKKSIIAMLMLAMLVQMTGSAFAASVDWESGGYYYTAYVNKTGSEQPKNITIVSGRHTAGTFTTLEVEAQTITVTIDTTFPSQYSTYLNGCLTSLELHKSLTVTIDETEYIINPMFSSGTYKLMQTFKGYAGTWGVLRGSSAEGTKSYIVNETAFSFAPYSIQTGLWLYP